MRRAVLKGPDFFFLLRTALKDRPKGPPTANRQLPSTANRHQPPTTNRHQPPPTASGDQPPPTMAEHMECPRAFFWENGFQNTFFFCVKDRPASALTKGPPPGGAGEGPNAV